MATPATATAPVQQASAEPATISDAPSQRSVPATIAGVANAAVSHLTPVSRAEAATAPPEPNEGWAVQMGSYRGEAAAERVAREVSRLGIARGKQTQILAPAGSERLYRARLVYFTAQGARTACAELHRQQRIECSVVPAGVKVANR
jgi:cell division protein FtsN